MSIFSGKLTPRGGVTARVEEKTPKLTATITDKTGGPKATISPVAGFSGSWARAGRFFSAVARPLAILYRFLSYRRGIAVSHSAKANAAPTVELQADSQVQAETAANAAAVPVAAAKVNQAERVGVYARATAYALALGRYIRGIAVGWKATAGTAPGAVAKYRRTVALRQSAAASPAPGAIAESRKNKIPTATVICGQFAEAIPGGATMDAKAELTAAATTATPVAGVVDLRINLVLTARASWWFLPEQVGDTLELLQVFSGIQDGETVEIDMETESAYWANAFVEDGTLNLVFAETATQTDNSMEVA